MTKEQTANEILGYLRSHPRTCDTLDGITNWWLSSDKGDNGVDEAKGAIALLIEKGELEEVKSQKEVVIYKIKENVIKT